MSFIRRSVHVVSKQLAYLVIILLVLAAASLVVVYWLSNEIEQRQDEISAWASDRIGYPVEIGHAGIDWLGLSPKLQLESVSILNKNKQSDLLSLDALYVGLDIVASIKRGEPVLNDMTLTGLTVSLERDLSGKISLKGLNLPTSTSTNSEWLSWIKILNRFHLKSIIVHYSDQLDTELSGKYQLTNAVVSHQFDSWTTTGLLRLPSNLGEQLQFQIQAEIEDEKIGVWQWEVKAKKLKVASLASRFIWKDMAIEQGLLDIDLSGRGSNTRLNSVMAELILANVELSSQWKDTTQETVTIESLTGMVEWLKQDDSWQLSGRNIQLTMNDDIWPETAFTIKKNNDDSWLAASNYFRLSDISALALLSEFSPEILRKQKPAGDIERFNLRYSNEQGVQGLAFSLSDGAVESWNDYPGVTGLTLSVNWNDGLADIKLNSHELNLYADKWLDSGVFFDSVTGSLAFQKSDKTWRLESSEFRIWNDDLTLQLDGQVEKGVDGEIVNDIKVKLEDVAVNQWQFYVPQKILNKQFKKWVDKAFQAGKIVDGEIEWVGKLSAFPYNTDEADKGFFNMTLNVEDIQLHYASGWPDIVGVNAVITGHGHDLVIKSKHGKIAGFDFANVTTNITKLNEKAPVLTVDGKLKGTSKQAVLFLQNSPLNKRFGSALESIVITGGSNIELDLMVPLGDTDATKVSGNVSFIDSQLHHASIADVGLEHVNGLLRFDNEGVYAEDIKATLFNESVEINVQPKGDTTAIIMRGQLATEQINSFWPNSVPTFIQGKATYTLNLSVLEKTMGDFYLNYSLSSELKGLEINIPAPFTKSKKDKKLLEVSVDTIDDNLVYFFKYGDEVNVTAVNENDNWRAAVKFGTEQDTLPQNGIKIRGKLTELFVDDWIDWSNNLGETQDNNLLSSIDDISMSIDRVAGFNQELTRLNYSINKDAQGWRVNLKSDQTGQGIIYWPVDFSGPAPLEITLDKLILLSAKEETTQDKIESASNITLWPAMVINVGTLQFNDMNLGAFKLNATRKDQTWKINTASLTSNVFTAEVIENSTYWQQLSDRDNSKLAVKVSSDNLAGLLAGFGYQQAIEAEQAQLTFDISWPQSPLNFSRENIRGDLNINIGKGKLNDIEPGAAGRIFGLMSIAALPRRLTLDFSDLFSKGFTFDSIKGDFKLEAGHAVTENLTLEGASAKIEMSGLTDLINKHYDQQVKITPNVSSTLPLAGAVAGGPIGLGVGAALFVVDKLAGKLFGKNIVNLISYKYDLTGPWSDPQLTVVKSVTP